MICSGGPDEPFVYGRGNLVLAVNPSSGCFELTQEAFAGRRLIYRIGNCALQEGLLSLSGQSFAVLGE